MTPRDFISKDFRYAIIGASNDPKKYGNIVMITLMESGYDVVPVNPKGGEILGKKVYPSISDAGSIDVAVMVVPRQVTAKLVQEINQKGIKKVWFQPGSESIESINYCLDNKIDCIHNACIMVESKKSA